MVLKSRITLLFLTFLIIIGSTWALRDDDTPFSNYQNTYTCQPGEIFDPASIEEVQAVIKRAVVENRKVMTGNRRFASQIDAACAETGEFQITLKNMDRLVAFDLRQQSITVEAGMRFNTFNDLVREQGLAINMVTELGTFTIGGMLGSGTHGSTLLKQGNTLADYVTRLKIVDGMGDVQILQGDLLDAARVNLGVLGVVVEVTLQLEPLFKVQASIKGYTDDSDLENTILSVARENYSANVAWFPGLGRYTVTTYNDVPVETPGDAYNAQAEVSDVEEFFFSLLFNALHEFPGSLLQCWAADIRYGRRESSYFRDSDSQKIVKNPVGYSDKMQYFSCKAPDQCIWDRLPIALQEIAIPIEQLPDWIADVRRILDSHPHTCFPLNGIYFRFGPASPSYLGMGAGHDVAYLGIEYTLRQAGNAVPKNYFVNLEIEQMSIRKYNGRPHWGKNSVAIFENVADKYPRWDDFLDAKSKLDPDGIFVNPFWQRLTGEVSLDDYLTDECNVRGECYCQDDSHCEAGYRCQSGAYYQDARICKK